MDSALSTYGTGRTSFVAIGLGGGCIWMSHCDAVVVGVVVQGADTAYPPRTARIDQR